MENYSLADIKAVTDGNGYDNFGGNGAWWIIILFLFMFGTNGWGNNRGNGFTDSEIQRGFDNQFIEAKLDSLGNGICDSTYALNNTIQQGNFALNNTILQGDYALNNTIMQGDYALQQKLSDISHQMENCCCETKQVIHNEGEATRALIRDNEIQVLRDKLQEANFTISQDAQNRYLLDTLGSFVTNPPLTTRTGYSCGGCGCY